METILNKEVVENVIHIKRIEERSAMVKQLTTCRMCLTVMRREHILMNATYFRAKSARELLRYWITHDFSRCSTEMMTSVRACVFACLKRYPTHEITF